jgi:hypothetical protein
VHERFPAKQALLFLSVFPVIPIIQTALPAAIFSHPRHARISAEDFPAMLAFPL